MSGFCPKPRVVYADREKQHKQNNRNCFFNAREMFKVFGARYAAMRLPAIIEQYQHKDQQSAACV